VVLESYRDAAILARQGLFLRGYGNTLLAYGAGEVVIARSPLNANPSAISGRP
jgi:hypothetical protein